MANNYVDSFIKQHTEYFKRNKAYIENNSWDDRKNSKILLLKRELTSLYDKDTSGMDEEEYEKYESEIESLESKIYSEIVKNHKNRSSLFKQECTITDSILGRLKYFIQQCEKKELRGLKKTQKFIDFSVDIINIHIKKCDKFLDYGAEDFEIGSFEDDIKIELNDHEIAFQDDIFQNKIKIQDTLNELNLTIEDSFKTIRFFNDEKASIPMMEVLPLIDLDIKNLTDNLDLPKEPIDLTFHIHRKKEDVPEWNPNKHYWEQSKEALQYWYSEWLKIKHGFTVDGYFFHPWLYYHLNFFRTPIPDEKGGDVIREPDLRDNEWFIAEQLKAITAEDGYYTTEGVVFYGARRIAKSTSMASICEWRALTVSNISTAITSGSEGDLTELTHKIKTSMTTKVPAFYLGIQKQDWEKSVTLGLKKDSSTILEHSRHTIKNLAGGAKSSSQKTAGGAPSVYLIEEIGKVKWEQSYLAAKASFETDFGLKTIIIAVGTSGEESLSGDALKAVSNPKMYNFREMDWDLFESKIPKEHITWKRRRFGTFIPGQMGYKTGFKRIKRGFGDFLGIKSEYLNGIDIYQTDWENNTKIIEESRKKVEKDNVKLQQEKVQYPIDPEECFISKEENPFPAEEARKHREHLVLTGKWDRRRQLYKDSNGKINVELTTKPLAEYPHDSSSIDAPYLILEDIPEEKPPKYTFVAGGDFYKQEQSDTESVGTIYIYKYNLFADEFSYKLAASYSARPASFTRFYERCLLLMEAYNAVLFPENEDLGGFQTFLERKRLEDYYLMPHIDFNSALIASQNPKRKYGWTPQQSKKKLLSMFAEYTKEAVVIQNDAGEEVEVKRIQTIDDIYLLDEVIKFNPEANVDRITASMGAVGFLHYLEKNHIYPKGMRRRFSDGAPEAPVKQKERKKHFYSKGGRQKSFYRKS